MAVVSCDLMDEVTSSFELGSYMVRVFYRVIVNSRLDGPQIVVNAAGLPALYSEYVYGNESNFEMLLRKFEPSRMGAAAMMAWKVACVYSTPPIKEATRDGGTGGGTGRETPGQFTNPLLELPTAKMHSAKREVLIHGVFDNRTNSFGPCAASSGEVFDPPPRRMQGYPTLTITRNEDISTAHPAIAVAYQDCVNADVFFGLKPGQWKIAEINPETQNRQIPGGSIYRYFRTSYVFEGDPNGWDLSLLDYGTYCWQSDSRGDSFPMVQSPFMAKGSACSAALDGRGNRLPPRLPFTVDLSTNFVTVPPTIPSVPYLEGTPVYVNNKNGALPAPLRVNTLYYVYNVVGTSFNLAQTFSANSREIIDVRDGGGVTTTFETSVAHGLVAGQTVVTTGVVDSDGTGLWNKKFVVLAANLTATTFQVALAADNADPDRAYYVCGGKVATPIIFTTAGSGTNYLWSPGVFYQVRPYQRVPFAPLGLPSSFAGCQ